MKRKGRLNPQTVGNAGLYFVLYRLSRLGWNAMPTSRNARGVDVLIDDENGGARRTVQVKALSRRSPVPLGRHLGNLIADFVVVCRRVLDDDPECFVLTTREVRAGVHRVVKDREVSYWLQPKAYEGEAHREAWRKIGKGTPAASFGARR